MDYLNKCHWPANGIAIQFEYIFVGAVQCFESKRKPETGCLNASSLMDHMHVNCKYRWCIRIGLMALRTNYLSAKRNETRRYHAPSIDNQPHIFLDSRYHELKFRDLMKSRIICELLVCVVLWLYLSCETVMMICNFRWMYLDSNESNA